MKIVDEPAVAQSEARDSAAFTRGPGTRADIQALRALAVMLVVLYHFWPNRLTGGFIGVDVFFVISGFLITTHLITKPPRTWRDLTSFWGRRIRRLLPASLLVLMVTLVVSVLFAPQTMWSSIAKQVAASALYVQNWFLAGEAVDYLAEDNAATPVQHFWSLGIEEQFYVVWPLLILAVLATCARFWRGRDRTAITIAIAVVTVASLAASVVLTEIDTAAAYFVSWTRAWELGVGALVACFYPLLQRWLSNREALRTTLFCVGLLLVGVPAVTYDASIPFPGIAAVLPVAGTAIVIIAWIDHTRRRVFSTIGTRPVQVLGDVSYSLYLWHWPAVVLLPLALGHTIHWPEKMLVIEGLILLSIGSKILVEDRFRGRGPRGRYRLPRPFVFAAATMALLVAASATTVWTVNRAEAAAASAIEESVSGGDPCFGANALVEDGCDPHGDELLTDPAFAAEDKPDPYRDDCWVAGDFEESDQRTCEYGSNDPGALKVALVGNSHGGHWLPALQEISNTTPWHITTYLISVCYTVDAEIDFGNETKTRNCQEWNQRSIAEIEQGDYDLVVFSNRTYAPLIGHTREETMSLAQYEYTEVLDRWTAADVPVLVLRDTPYATDLTNVPDCVAQHSDDLAACDGTRDREQKDPLAKAAASHDSPLVKMLDFTDRICAGDVCYSTIGGTIVYFDRGHLSGTFARSLAPAIQSSARELLQRAG